MINEETITQWWDIFQHGREFPLVEIRILEGKKTLSGYFTDLQTMLTELRKMPEKGVYATINEIDPACYERRQKDHIVEMKGGQDVTTSAENIIHRRVLFIDLDTERPKGTNATKEEVLLSKQRADQIDTFLRSRGFKQPVIAMSGNGIHMYYKISVRANAESNDTIKHFYSALSAIFSDDRIKIDQAVSDPNRIAKLIGTSSPKGSAESTVRPQRQSRFVSVPPIWETTEFGFIEKIAEQDPEKQVEHMASRRSSGWRNLDIDAFIEKHNIGVASRKRWGDGEKIVLESCPFCGHGAPDSALFKFNGGAAFMCFHNSCHGKHLRDFLLYYDPHALDRDEYLDYRRSRRYDDRVEKVPPQAVPEDERGPKWLDPTEIEWMDWENTRAILTGIVPLDRCLRGLLPAQLTIISGGNASGKTVFLNTLILSAVQQGFKASIWSGEMPAPQLLSWLDQAAAGRGYTKPSMYDETSYYLPKETAQKVNEWLRGKVKIYNNDYGQRWSQLFADIKSVVEKEGTQLVLIDNLMALTLDPYEGEKYDRQTAFINDLKNYAKKMNIHVVLVCHPRKEPGMTLLRKDSISGTADLTNMCDNLFIMHRVGNDFEKRGSAFFGVKKLQEYMIYDVVLEVAKNRSHGIVDKLIGLYYEKESRRIKSDLLETKTYDWVDTPVKKEVDDEFDMPEDLFESKRY